MLTYAFDACGLPLLGAVTRQDIAHRLDVCPAPAARKEALRVVFQRAIADARLTVIDSGHVPHTTDPEHVAAELVPFADAAFAAVTAVAGE